MLVDLLAVVAGLALLTASADQLVLGAARVAVELKVSPVVVGALIVGFGTSAPELLVSAVAAHRGDLDIAVGNIVGSNLANLTLVLGLAGLVTTLHVLPRVERREAPLSLAAVLLFAVLVQDGLHRWEGIVLAVAMIAAVTAVLVSGDGEDDPAVGELVHEVQELVEGPGEDELADVRRAPKLRDVVRTLVGLGGTLLGAQLLVGGAIDVADAAGLSSGFVGLTLVAVGTSLPELVTSLQAARRDEVALLVGNVLGSNVFNSLAVGAVAALVGPARLTDADLTVTAVLAMSAVAVIACVILVAGASVRRWQAGALLACYAAAVPLMA